jgi:fructokinase
MRSSVRLTSFIGDSEAQESVRERCTLACSTATASTDAGTPRAARARQSASPILFFVIARASRARRGAQRLAFRVVRNLQKRLTAMGGMGDMRNDRDLLRSTTLGRPLVFGEVLFDEFEDGTARLGGAPLNVAWHLRGFGLDPLLITRVGEDALGGLALERMRTALLDTRGVQVDAGRPTGRAAVVPTGGDGPKFSIANEQAFDFVDRDLMPHVPRERFEILYHGSLAARSESSAAALQSLREIGLPIFIDVNLRAPWWNRGSLEGLIGGARWLKLNTEELEQLEDPARGRTLLDRAQRVRERFGLEYVIVTCGCEGAFAVTEDDSVTAPAERILEETDSVGLGDAVSAVAILGIVRGWSLQAILRRAVEFASAVHAGIPDDPALYQRFLGLWRR